MVRKVVLLVILALLSLPAVSSQGFNFDGDRKSDIGIYRPSVGQFWWINSANGALRSFGQGNPGDIPIAADYDGDGKTDLAIYRPGVAQFWWTASSTGILHSSSFGNPGDIPLVADFDGDGKTDIAIYRPSTAAFWWITSADGVLHSSVFGIQGDVPVAADFDGDGKTDIAVYRPSTGTFWWTRSSDHQLVSQQIGITGDIPVVGDFDGDHRNDPAIYRHSTSTFIWLSSSTGHTSSLALGQPGDIPILGDYDGDGKTDLAVFRPGINGFNTFFYMPSSSPGQTTQIVFGNPNDYPLGNETQEPSIAGDNGITFNASPSAVQTLYQGGVPNTDKNGRPRTSLQSDSFFPRCFYHGLTSYTNSQSNPVVSYSFSQLQSAGYNCDVPQPDENAQPLSVVLADAASFNIQIIRETIVSIAPGAPDVPTQINTYVNLVTQFKDNPNILAWLGEEEPTGNGNSSQRFANFGKLKSAIGNVDTVHPVFVLDNQNIDQSDWKMWNTSNSISSHDNYPYLANSTVSSLNSSRGIPASVGAAVTDNLEQKPVWLTVQAHEILTGTLPLIFPTTTQLRAEIYAGIIHGATGIIYFTEDSYVSRNSSVVGIAPTPVANYNFPAYSITATPLELQESVQLWSAAASFNQELIRYQNIIFTPTSVIPYQVAFSGQPVSATPIRTLLKLKDGVYTLFVVNLDKTNLTAKFTFPSRPFSLSRVDVDGSLYALAPTLSSFEEAFGPFEVKIYQFQ